MRKIITCFFIAFAFVSCGNGYEQNKVNDEHPVGEKTSVTLGGRFQVAYKDSETMRNIKMINVKFNDVASFDCIFDTGCSCLSISRLELANLFKYKVISDLDRLGTSQVTIANGSSYSVERYRINEVTLMDVNGQPHTVKNVIATIQENQDADILVGGEVLDQLATSSYTVDLSRNLIIFN